MSNNNIAYIDKLGTANSVNTAGAWVLRTVTSAPANTVIDLGFGSPAANRTIGAREVGSAQTPLRTLLSGNMAIMRVKTNASGQIEFYSSAGVVFYYWGFEQ